VPTITTISALQAIRCSDGIMERHEMYASLKRKISTAKLNNWVLERHHHPLVKGRTIKMILLKLVLNFQLFL